MPSRSFLDNQPATPSIKHHPVVVETADHATTSPLTSSLGGSPSRNIGDRTPDYPLARTGVMSHYPSHHPSHQPQSQHSPPSSNAGRDPRYMQMISTGGPPPHFQGATHHVAYLPPTIPPLYGGAPPPGSYPPPPQQQHPGGSPRQHQTYVIAGYPPGHGHQQGHPPAGGSQYYAVSSYPPQGGGYHPHHPPPHGGHPQSPHNPHGSRPHPGHQATSPHAPPVYVRHGAPPPPGSSQYPVMYSQRSAPPRAGPPGAPESSGHPSTVSKASTQEKEAAGYDQVKGPRQPMQTMEEMQAEREKEEEAMEEVLKSVKPIQTDYHLFIAEEKNKLAELAAKDAGDDAYLRNSNLNYRLKAAWENLDSSQRAIFSSEKNWIENDSWRKKKLPVDTVLPLQQEILRRHLARNLSLPLK
mmetsp:Transcript_23217/g.44216  ORF Transcript_23217/g.44216 Transcript_23217/m.44216 type:complete len:412 (-) Transcript_23217:173-1408(-)